ncbi:MAG TPA: PAS domain S-box protein, partial [Candidatus Omnitrophota bacterium]|nr:PAS domain S-box protein [Candidatus Omnitrophota bacterium]
MTENQKTIEELMKEIEFLRGRIQELEAEAKETEEKLKEQEAFTRTVMDHLPIGIAVNSIDPAVFRYMNDNFVKYYRVTREELASPDVFWEVVYPNEAEREKTRKKVFEDCASGDPERMVWNDVPINRPGEKTFFVSARNIPIPGKPFMISTVQDTTEYVQIMSALRESERQFRTLFENMSTGFALHKIVTNEKGEPVDYIFLAANPAFERETGLKREHILGKRVTEVLPGIENDPADWIHFYGQVAIERKAQTVERYSAALKRWYSVVAYSPAPGQFAAVFSDISDRKRIEEETEKARMFLNAIINTIADPVFVKDSEHRWILLN